MEQKKNMERLTRLGFGFLLLFISYMSVLNLVTITYEKNGYNQLGFDSISVIYISWGLGSIFSPIVIKIAGQRWAIALGALSNCGWILGAVLSTMHKPTEPDQDDQFYLTVNFMYGLVLTLSCLNGFFNGPMWVAAGTYISNCAGQENYASCFSYFWLFYVSSQIFGNLIAGVVFQYMDQFEFFSIMACISFFSSMFFLHCMEYNFKRSQAEVDGYQVLISHNTIEETKDRINIAHDLKQVFVFMVQPKMMLAIPQMFLTGISIAIYSGTFSAMLHLSMDPSMTVNKKFSYGMFTLSLMGVGSMIGTLQIGKIIDHKGNKYAVMANLFVLIIALLTLSGFIIDKKFNEVYTFLFELCWGVFDSQINTHMMSFLGSQFNNDPNAYSIFNLFQSLGVLIFVQVQANMKEWSDYQIYFETIGIAAVFCVLLMFFAKTEWKENPN